VRGVGTTAQDDRAPRANKRQGPDGRALPRTMRSPSTSTVEDFSSALFPAGRSGTFSESTWLVEGLQMGQGYQHEPVMVDEVVASLAPVPPGFVIDATLGGGGHASAVLESRGDLELLGIDRDRRALEAATVRLQPFAGRVVLRQARFSALAQVADEALPIGARVAAVVFDLGVSSPQLDVPERGFSYRQDAPLDMRMDQETGTSALELVNEASVEELARLFAQNGEGRLAARLARAIVAARPVATTGQLAEVVAAAVPQALRRRGHPARRVFQALRLAVNEELEELAAALRPAIELLDVGGRCLVIAYHSGEDRMVKSVFAEAATGGCTCPPGLPCVCGATPEFELVARGAKKARAEEVAQNSRAEAARLRVLQRIEIAP
jgi:16S rRNA (cytosine1402-N4)-methyltransferase